MTGPAGVAADGAPAKAVARPAAERLVRAAAALSLAAALIHASVIVAHFQEYWLFGVFFVSAALFQLGWGVAAWSSSADRRLLALGAGANLAIVLLWAVTRTVGLPIGPGPGEIEPAGLHDLFATADELAILLAAGLVLVAAGRHAAPSAWLVAPLWILAAISGVSAFLGSHSA